MLQFLKALTKSRVKDIEAKLRPVAMGAYQGKGEVEYEEFSDGSAHLEIELKFGTMQSGTTVVVKVGKTELGIVSVFEGRVKEYRRFVSGDDLPKLDIGDRVVFEIDGIVCFSGEFRRD